MASPGQIQIYSPARQLPPGFVGRQPPPPPRPTPQQARAGRKATPALAGRWSALAPYVQAESDKVTQARAQEAAVEAQKAAQKVAQDAAYQKLPWWKKGLAAVIDNPVTKVALAPAEVLSVGMKGVAVGKEELSSHLPYDVAQWLEDPFNIHDDTKGKPAGVNAVGNVLGHALDRIAKAVPLSPVGVDTDKARAEKRSVLERLAPRSDFGHGQILTTTGSKWGDRFQGLTADVLNDPLMLLEGGGTVARPAIAAEDALKAIGRGERLALPEAQRALMTADRAATEAAERAASAAPIGVRTAEEEIARQAAGRGSAEARFADNIHRPRVGRPEAEIPLPKNLQERMNLASEWATENPELWRKHQGEVSKGIKRGFESMSPAAKADFGVKTGGISVRGIGVELPGSEALRQVWKDAGGARRAKTADLLDKLPKEGTWDKVRNMRVPKGQESAYASLRRAGTSSEEAELALNNVFVRNQIDIGKGQMKAKGAVHLRKTLRELRDKYNDAEIAQLVREAETTDLPNEVNQLFKKLADEHERLTGRNLVSSISGDTYLPHTLDSKWRRFMLANPDDPFVKSFMRANDIVKDDLLEASHYLDKSRKLRLPEGVAEAEFDFAGRKVKLKGNSVAAKNEAMHEAFPEWKGDFYSTDLGTIGESYLDSISNDAGAHFARQQLANTKSPFVRTLDGLLWDEYQKMNETLAQRPYARRVTNVTAEGYKTGTGVEDIAPSPASPTSEYFRTEKDVNATEQLAEDVQGAGRQWRRDMNADAADVYEKAQDDLGTLRRSMSEGLRNEAKAGNPRIKALQKQIESYKSWVKGLKLGDITSDNADQLVKVLANVDDHIAFLKRELSNTNRVWNGKITRESKKVDQELAAELRKLTQIRADLEEHVSNVGSRLRAEIEERRAWINGDVTEKEAALAAKEKTVPKPSPSDPDVTDMALEHTGIKGSPDYQPMVDRYTEAIRALQSSREDGMLFTKAGMVRRSEQRLIDEVEAARDDLRRVGGAVPAERDPGVVFNGKDKQGRNRYKTSTGYRIEPAAPKAEMVKVRDGGPVRRRFEKRIRPQYRVFGPDNKPVRTFDTWEAARTHVEARHKELLIPEVVPNYPEKGAYRQALDDLAAARAAEDDAAVAAIEKRLAPGGDLHPHVQAANWHAKQGRYQVDLENATKEERAAVKAAHAARDERAGQRESIVRSGPEVGNQNWPTESTNQVRAAEQEVAAKAAEVPRPFSPAKTQRARELEAEEQTLMKLRYEGTVTPEEYAKRMDALNRARERQLEDLKLVSGRDKPPGEINRLRNQIESNHNIAVRRLTEQYEARLPADEFERRMAVIQARKARLARGPRQVSESATEAAREAARKRVALEQQAPHRVVDPEVFEEGALVKPTIDVKAVKHGQGHFVLEHPDTGEIYAIDVDRASKRPKWDVTLPNGEGDSFPSLREATEYARGEMARGLATTEAQRAALPPMTPDAYAEATGAITRSERAKQAANTRKLATTPAAQDIISADEWYKANVRAATAPERERLNQAKAYAKQRERFAAATPEPDPRWVEPLGGFGYDERRLVGADKPKQLKGVHKDVADAYIEAAARNGLSPDQAIENARKNLEGAFYKSEVDDILQGMADHYYDQSGRAEPQISRHVERINTPPQPEAFASSAVSAETGQLVGVPPPRTEGEAVAHLETQLQPGTENIVPGSELHNKVVAPFEQAKAVEEQYASEIPFKSAEAKERINTEFGAERDERLGEISVEQGVFKNLKDDLTERESLLRKRKELNTLREKLMKTPARARNEELLEVVEQLEAIARANPLLDNAQLNAAESLLHTHKEALERIAKAERLKFQVKNLEDMAAKGEIDDVFRAVLNDNWRAMHDGLLAKGDVIIDHRLAAALQNVYELGKEPGLFGRTFNAFTNLFKTYATLSPGFQVRNALSGMFMNTADGVGLRTQLEGATLWRKWERGGVDWLEKQPQRIQDAFAASFASGAGGRVAEAGVAGKSANRIYDKLSNNPATRGFQRWGEKVEGGLRLGMALHSMDRGETVASAVRRIGRVHFNYAEVSAFDEQAKRLIPFWTFMSRNLPLQLQEIFTNPAAYAAYGHVKRNFEGAKEENEPEYWKGLGTWRLPFDMAGQPAYFQPDFGFTRMGQDIENVTDTLTMRKPLAFMNSVNPGFSAPLDFMYGKDSFTDRTYGPNDYSKVSGPVGAITQVLASIAGQTNEAGQVSDNFQNFLRSINPIQDRVTRLAPGAAGGTADPRRLAESWGRFIGVPVRQLSPKQQESEAMRKYYEMLDEARRQTAMAREQAS